MGLSAVLFMQLAASSDQHGLHKAAKQFLCLPSQTRRVLLEAQLAPAPEFPPAVLLHQPAIRYPPAPERQTLPLRRPRHRSLWPAAITASSSRRVFIGQLALAADFALCEGCQGAGRDQTTPNRQSATSNCNAHGPLIGNSEHTALHRPQATGSTQCHVSRSTWHLVHSPQPWA